MYQWLENKKIFYKGENYTIPDCQPNIWQGRYPSGTEKIWLKLPYPFSTYELHHLERDTVRENNEPLVKSGLPSFSSLTAATHYYLFGKEALPEHAIPEIFIFYIARLEARLEKLDLLPNAIKIQISGTKVKGVRLEVRVGMKYYEKILHKSCKQTILMRKGLTESIWVALTNGDQWIDYRSLNKYSLQTQKIISEIKDQSAELKEIISRGEGETTEFKEMIPDRSEKLTKTVAAFANGKGGIIIVGIEDDGLIVGVKGDISAENARLVKLIRSSVLPQPAVRVDSMEVDGKWVLAVWVEAGENTPYAINPQSPRYYVRHSANSFYGNP